MTAVLRAIAGMAVLAASSGQGLTAESAEPVARIFRSVLRQSIGAPARASLGEQGTERLAGNLVMIPPEPAARLLTALGQPVPSDFMGLLLGAEGMRTAGIIRFFPVGFIDADVALAFTADDILASLRETVERGNAARVKEGLAEREARRWVQPPHYSPETHQLSWAALILPKNAPPDADGDITYYAVGFGREGYMQLAIVTSVPGVEEAARMADSFLAGLNFAPGKEYHDFQPSDPRAPGGLGGALGIDSLGKAHVASNVLFSDIVVPITGCIVAGIGSLGLILTKQRHRRQEARRG